MPPITRIQGQECDRNYFCKRLKDISSPNWEAWINKRVLCIPLFFTSLAGFKTSRRGMLLRDILPLSLSSWPFLFGHCFLTSFLLLFQGELQKSCSRTIAEKASESCQLTCQCRPYPPLPPPPPPPPPPRLLVSQSKCCFFSPFQQGVELIEMGGQVALLRCYFSLLSAILIQDT
uniref:Proline rich membrane anchor 1 n=1 Tax=Lepisosteus oculatus TaxID=7918 RepID=W5N5Z8_LEPOC